jgi:DNA-binding NarL/FixJ family response regulator
MSQTVRVLIADDQPRARRSLKALLATWPQVEVAAEAADGQEAVGLVAEQQPDVVLMDLRMPALDGLAATRIIKERWPGVRVIALTMYADYQAADARAAGADAFLIKGCPPDELMQAILGRGQVDDLK